MQRDIAYGTEARQVLDVYAPVTEKPFPVLIAVSGGGWRQGSKDWIAHLGGYFSGQGFGVVTVDHRLYPEFEPQEQAQDIAEAIRWVIAHIADYGGNPEQIFVTGHSAGGHLTMLAALHPDYLRPRERAHIRGMIPVSAALNVETYFSPDAAPLNFIRANLPPFLILTSEGDQAMSRTDAENLTARLAEVGVPAEYQIIPNTDHFSIIGDSQTLEIVLNWMQKGLESNG